MRYALTILTLSTLSHASVASPFGVGIDSDEKVRVPIVATKRILVEPTIGWSADRYRYGQSLVKSSGTHLGLGIFYFNDPETPLATYLGARAWRENTRASAGPNDGGKTKTSGFAPTAGVQYRLTPSLSLAGEIYYSYAKRNNSTTGGFGTSVSDTSSNATQKISGQIVMRFVFDER